MKFKIETVHVKPHPTRKLNKEGLKDPTDYDNCVDITDYKALAKKLQADFIKKVEKEK